VLNPLSNAENEFSNIIIYQPLDDVALCYGQNGRKLGQK
jgi:hypothetical protein